MIERLYVICAQLVTTLLSGLPPDTGIIVSPWEGEDISSLYSHAYERNWEPFPVLLDSLSFRQVGDSQWIRDRRKELQGRAMFVYKFS